MGLLENTTFINEWKARLIFVILDLIVVIQKKVAHAVTIHKIEAN